MAAKLLCLLYMKKDSLRTALKSLIPLEIVKKICGLATIFALFALVALSARAHTPGLPEGWETYLDRPDILSMQAQSFQQPDANWENLKAAHFSFIAFLLEAYPAKIKIYFLARDSEHLYDVARLVTQGTKDADRVHLLNVSRANMRDKNLIPYLNQNGITEEGLRHGEKILFVDTGFAGTIPRVIAESFPVDVREQLTTQLLVSSNASHPSSRTFLVHLNAMINEVPPTQMHGTIIGYEHMPRYTDRSSHYVEIKGTYHPLSSLKKVSDGSVDKEGSEAFMKDLIASWKSPQTRAHFKFEREQAKWFHLALRDGSEAAKVQLRDRLQLENESARHLAEAQIRDFIEVTKNTQELYKIGLEDIGLKAVKSSQGISKKNELIKKFPEWAPYLENPNDKIPDLFFKKNWQMIGNLIDANVDAEVNWILVKNLYDAPATGIKKGLQVLMIEKADVETLKLLATHTFSRPYTKDMGDLLKLLIEKADVEVLRLLAVTVFSQPHTQDMHDLLKLVIKKGRSRTWQHLAKYTFSQPHTQGMHDLLKLMIEKADAETLRALAKFTFSMPHTQGAKFDSLRKAIAAKDNMARGYLEMSSVESQDPVLCEAMFR